MSEPANVPLTIGPASTAELPAALQLVFGRFDAAQRQMQIAEAQAEIERRGGEGQVVMVARRDSAVTAAIWVQIQPGRVASLWPPGLSSGETEATAATLIDLGIAKAAAAGVRLVQALLETDAGREARWLARCGFQHTADLLYLVSPREAFPTTAPVSELEFEAVGTLPSHWERLTEIVGRTYVDTRDCPAVQGLRSNDDVLDSYRAVGSFDPSRWFIVCHQHDDVGCLLLADHPAQQQWELVYMGLVPEARGRGWGLETVRYAQWLASQTSVERLVLAVDAANSPAIAVYSAAGFQTWDRRSVFLLSCAKS